MPAPLLPTVDAATRRRRRIEVAAALGRLRLCTVLAPRSATRRRERVQVCGAARILTALDVRVRVVAPRTPWPRHRPCRLVLADDIGWLGDLALVTAVPRTTEGWASAVERSLPGTGRTATHELAAPDAVACPVALRYRTESGALDRPPHTLDEIVAARGLVVEVHLLPAIDLALDRALDPCLHGGAPQEVLTPAR